MTVGGIRSTGLTASPAIAEHVLTLLAASGLELTRKDRIVGVQMPPLGEATTRPFADPVQITADPAYGRIVCHCERVTAGELRDACASTVVPHDIDGLRRRTRARWAGATASPASPPSPTSSPPAPVLMGQGDRFGGAARQKRGRRVGDRRRAGRVGRGNRVARARSGHRCGRRTRTRNRAASPRHSDHTGYGLRDLHRVIARPHIRTALWTDRAERAGVDIRTETSVTGGAGRPPTTVEITSPAGRAVVAARGHLLATGCRERPASGPSRAGHPPERGADNRARCNGSSRAELPVGTRAVVVGAEHVSYSAALTLRRRGRCRRRHGDARADAPTFAVQCSPCGTHYDPAARSAPR